MADQHFSAPTRVPSGIRHINHDHRRGYVKIGNHLAQHRELSLTAIGLATHIQSLPTGAKVTIKALAERFPEGEVRIAAALHELEDRGYLARFQERLPSGRVVTRTVSYNNPPAMSAETAHERRVHASGPEPKPDPDQEPEPEPEPEPDPEPAPDPDPEPAPGSASEPTPPVSEAELQARELLARLRLRDPRLVLSERDTVRLAPAAAVWLERGLTPSAVAAVLTRTLPMTPIHSPAGLLTHRLRELVPPRLPDSGAARPVPPDRTVHPLRTCDCCDRAFRSPTPGNCRDCAPSADAA
ncbi:helix-turn-helix domain-containing protein [Streptomyces sp. NBC_01443]|uniref:helix-turn-helix domain-containing protein n=1 Tax=Streptomyces sp. NBC_01443 TaxID=2903868 RepID=UPI002252E173|nr:helix-turn-helix domain-containing protein [Streptomyces sp. NBC_01443]MCX4630190.1 helix-turn-helix domain-containing protein [Streptomyces sp. NBC_01443]